MFRPDTFVVRGPVVLSAVLLTLTPTLYVEHIERNRMCAGIRFRSSIHHFVFRCWEYPEQLEQRTGVTD